MKTTKKVATATQKKTINKRAVKATQKKKPKLRASQTAQWSTCSKSLDFSESKNPLQDSRAAERGTFLHSLAEVFMREFPETTVETLPGALSELLDRVQPDKIKNLKDRVYFIENETEVYELLLFSLTKVVSDLQYFRTTHGAENVRVFIEKTMKEEMTGYTIGGTPDLIVMLSQTAGGGVYIYDYKFGRALVEAEENLQLYVYAHLLGRSFAGSKGDFGDFADSVDITGVIIQPRLNSITSAPITYNQKFLEGLYTDPKTRKYSVGRPCLYCDYCEVCPAFKRAMKTFLKPELNDESLDRLSEWSEFLRWAEPVKKAIDRIQKTVKTAIDSGVVVKGVSIAQRPGKRQWVSKLSETDIKSKLKIKKVDLYDTKLKSPAQVEKVVGKENLRGLVYFPLYSKIVFDD